MNKNISSGLNLEAFAGLKIGNSRKKWRFRARSLRTLLRMGHCAPAVVQTLTDICGFEDEWPILAAAGLPGGIGDTGAECGGITSPLILLGMRYGLRDLRDGLPVIFDKGHDYFRQFEDRNHSPFCREIRGDSYRLSRCIKAVCGAPEIAASTFFQDGYKAIVGERRQAYGLLYSHMAERGFHCAHRVFHRLSPAIPCSPELLEASAAFLGGTLFKGLTCSAYAAGVMSIGLRIGEIEDSFPRVLRMIVLMKTGGNAFATHLNKFNRAMNLGNNLAQRFSAEFGDIQCQTITGCDFSSLSAVNRYIETDGLARCSDIADKVADMVLSLWPADQAR